MIGINIIGEYSGISGLGESVRLNTLALQSVGVETSLINYIPWLKSDSDKKDTQFTKFENATPHAINLININYNMFSEFMETIPADFLKGKYNIAQWAWEMQDPPDDVKQYFEFLDEIWVPSQFCADALSKISHLPIIKIPHPIHFELSNSTFVKPSNAPSNKFVFLTIFDYLSNIERKNTLAVIKAFNEAFNNDEKDVVLIVKTINSDENKKDKILISEALNKNPNIIIIDEKIPRGEILKLYQTCDVYISLHRSEGFGLTMAEAMYFGKPTIATAYSANIEFMNSFNSFLVDFILIPDEGSLKKGSLWAEPNIQDAAEKMKFIHQNYALALVKGERAKNDIHEQLSLEKIGNRMKNRLTIIENHLLDKERKSSEKMIEMQQENVRLRKRNRSLEKKLIHRAIDGYNFLLKKIFK